MSLALITMFQNEEAFLSLHLPYLLQADAIDGVVAVDGGSTDNSASAIARACHVADKHMAIYLRPFLWDFSAQANFLIACAEQLGYTHLLRLDPDELMFVEDINRTRSYLESGELRGLPLGLKRYTFEGDRRHYMPQYTPDWQVRAWPVNEATRYSGRVHERLSGFSYQMNDLTIYHYEGLRRDTARRLKHINYARIAAGHLPLAAVPENDDPGGLRPREVFAAPQPLDPAVIGESAPF